MSEWLNLLYGFCCFIVILGLSTIVLGWLSRPRRLSGQSKIEELHTGDKVELTVDQNIADKIELLNDKMDLNNELYIGFMNEAEYLDTKCKTTYNDELINTLQIKAAKYRLQANKIAHENNRIMREREELILKYGKPIQVVKR